MASTDNQAMIAQKFVAGVETAFIQAKLPMDFIRNAKMDVAPFHDAYEMGFSLGMQMATAEVLEKIEPDETQESDERIIDYYKVPADWFEAVKERLATTRFKNLVHKRWGDVVYKQIPISKITNKVVRRVHKHLHTCPLPEGSSNQAYFTFLTWDTPFEGSRAEWLAMKRVMDALMKLSPMQIPNIEVMRAVSDYRVAQQQRTYRARNR